MFVIKPEHLFEHFLKSPFLYHTTLGGIANIHVTHTHGCDHDPYIGNLALHVQDNPNAVQERRAKLRNIVGKPIQWLNQIHGTTVYTATTHNIALETPIADASITQSSELALAILTADCLPVVFTAHNVQNNRAVGIAHAGWRGLLAGVLQNTATALRHAVPNATLHAHLAPCISTAQFEVSDEVREAFITQNNSSRIWFTASSTTGKYLCDLEGLARQILTNNPIKIAKITGGGWCTVSDTRLASYRRQAVTGRFATLISLN